MKLAVIGAGYVGLSVAAVLARRHEVWIVDVVKEKVDLLAAGKSPIRDDGLSSWLEDRELDLHPTIDAPLAYEGARFVIVAVPTSFDDATNRFDTSAVDSVVQQAMAANPEATIVVKSTVPVGYIDLLCSCFPQGRFLFSPEFLREGHALNDNAHPSRVIVGIPDARTDDESLVRDAHEFATLLADAALEDQVPTFVMRAEEAESVKLFANTYLAMRVSFFNELDTFAMAKGLDAGKIVSGICADPRIGDYYNNPSFGYGGYCLPKDSKQLLANYRGVPQNVIGAVVASNATRKGAVVQGILAKVDALAQSSGRSRRDVAVGIYRLITKAESDNFRSTAIADVMARLVEEGVTLCVYEPYLQGEKYADAVVERELGDFKRDCELIVANRMDDNLRDVGEKVYTRDLYGRD